MEPLTQQMIHDIRETARLINLSEIPYRERVAVVKTLTSLADKLESAYVRPPQPLPPSPNPQQGPSD